jgi:hypothetical protein
MQRPQLEHIIRAAAGITGTPQFVVIGSQAIPGQFPNPPEELVISIEADLASPLPRSAGEKTRPSLPLKAYEKIAT